MRDFWDNSTLDRKSSEIADELKEFAEFQSLTTSSFGLADPAVQNLISGRDYSFEESRLDFYQAQQNNSIPDYEKTINIRTQDMKNCIDFLKKDTKKAARYTQLTAKQKYENPNESFNIKPFIESPLDLTGNSLAANSQSGAFGSSPFGATSNASNPFGSSTTFNPFGGSNTSPFGNQNTKPSVFGSSNLSQNTTNSAFGQSSFGKAPAAGAFGSQSLGSTGSSAFGQSAFGNQTSTNTSPFGGKSLGATTTTPSSGSAFGSSGFGSSGFGTGNTATTNSAFGSTAFGAAKPSTSSAFGSSTFGATPSNPSTSSAFGSSTFGTAPANPSTSSAFGSSTFGAAPAASNTTSAFGGASLGSTTTANSAFGSSGFGQSTASTSPFGQSTTTPNSTSIFGQSGTSNTSLLGNTNSNTSAFGKPQASSGLGTVSFGGFGKSLDPGSGASFKPAFKQAANDEPRAKEDELSDQVKEHFTANEFTIGMVPEIPPPLAYC